MSNNSPDRGYATPTTDLFTYRWPQHLKSVAGGVGEGGWVGISRVGHCPCKRVRGKPSLRTSGDKCCALILSVTFFFCWLSEWLNSRGSNSSHRNVTLSKNSSCNMTFMRFAVFAGWALKLYFLKVAWNDLSVLQEQVERELNQQHVLASNKNKGYVQVKSFNVHHKGFDSRLHPYLLKHSAGGTVGNREIRVHLWGYLRWRHSLFTRRCVHSPGVYTLFNTPHPFPYQKHHKD